MNEKLIKQLQEGTIAVKNNGSLDDLRKVLKYACPKDNWPISGTYSFYIVYNIEWKGVSQTKLPSYSVKEFLKEEEFVLPRFWCVHANEDNINVIANFYNTANRKQKTNTYNRSHVNQYFSSHNLGNGNSILDEYPNMNFLINKLVNYPKYKEITFEQFKKHILKEETMEKKIIGYKVIKEYPGSRNKGYITQSDYKHYPEYYEPVYEEEIKLPKINNYEAEINGDFLVYGCAKFAIRNIKDLCEDILSFNKPDVKLERYSGGNRPIASVELSSGVTITVAQLEQILKYLNAKGL